MKGGLVRAAIGSSRTDLVDELALVSMDGTGDLLLGEDGGTRRKQV
jgi:hypothetical protein